MIGKLQVLTLLGRSERAVLDNPVALLPAPVLKFNQGLKGAKRFMEFPTAIELAALLGFVQLLFVLTKVSEYSAFYEPFQMFALISCLITAEVVFFEIGLEGSKAR